jgi:hypothetical protein
VLTSQQIKDIYERPPIVPNQGWFWRPLQHPPPPGPQGWYDFRPLLKVLASQAPPPSQDQTAHPVASSAVQKSGTGEAASSQ